MSFTGFPPAGLALLARLPFLDTAGFAAVRGEWEELLLGPAGQFVDDLGVVLIERISPGLIADASGNGGLHLQPDQFSRGTAPGC